MNKALSDVNKRHLYRAFSYPCPIPVHRDVRADAAAFPESVDGFRIVTINRPASQQNEWCR